MFMGYGVEAEVKAIGTCRIRLSTNFDLDLVNTLFVPSIRRNLFFVPKLELLKETSSVSSNVHKMKFNVKR